MGCGSSLQHVECLGLLEWFPLDHLRALAGRVAAACHMTVAEQHQQYDIEFEAPAYDPDHRPDYILLIEATGAALCILSVFSLVAALWRRVFAAAASTGWGTCRHHLLLCQMNAPITNVVRID